ncbi:cobalamin biosynthesis protein [Yinghuangia aomiensis]
MPPWLRWTPPNSPPSPCPTSSPAVRARVGTPSVAEAAALRACGADADLVIPKTRSAGTPSLCTIAVARRQVGRNGSTNAT